VQVRDAGTDHAARVQSGIRLKRGETTASPAQLMALNGLTAENIMKRAWNWLT